MIINLVYFKNMFKNLCIPESCNKNISHQLFDYQIITFVNSQHENKNSKYDFVLKNRFETFVLKLLVCKNESELKYILHSIFRDYWQFNTSTKLPSHTRFIQVAILDRTLNIDAKIIYS